MSNRDSSDNCSRGPTRTRHTAQHAFGLHATWIPNGHQQGRPRQLERFLPIKLPDDSVKLTCGIERHHLRLLVGVIPPEEYLQTMGWRLELSQGGEDENMPQLTRLFTPDFDLFLESMLDFEIPILSISTSSASATDTLQSA